jgi:hypothetical protein
MKKWLSFFAAAVLATGPVANVISCDKIDVYNVIRLDMMSKRIFDMLITDEYDDSNDVIADRGEDDQVVGQDGIGPELWFYRAIAHVFETSKYRMTIPELKKELSFQFFDINGKPVDGQELNLKIEFSFIATATSTSTKFIGQTDQITVKQCLIIGDADHPEADFKEKLADVYESWKYQDLLDYEFSLTDYEGMVDKLYSLNYSSERSYTFLNNYQVNFETEVDAKDETIGDFIITVNARSDRFLFLKDTGEEQYDKIVIPFTIDSN